MQNFKIFFSLMFLFWGGFSCSSPVDQIFIDTSTRYPFIECVINTDSIISGNFTYSFPLNANVTSDSFFNNLEPVKVLIEKDGIFLDSLIRFGTFPYHYKSKHKLKAFLGSIYKLHLEYPDSFYSITKQIRIPSSSLVTSSDTNYDLEVVTLIRNGAKQDLVKHRVIFEIDDPKDEKNYYTLSLKNITNTIWTTPSPNSGLEYSTYFSMNLPDDPVFFYYDNEGSSSIEEFHKFFPYQSLVAFSDHSFNGKKFQLIVEFSTNETYAEFLTLNDEGSSFPDLIYIQEIDYDYYQYIRTVNLAFNKQNQPFREPTQIWSNIDGGIGIISGMRTLKTIGLTPKGMKWIDER